MPIYEYRCAACGFQKEYLQRMSDAPLADCPECGKPQFSKMMTAAGFQLKGSGWYATDFKNGSKPAPAADKAAADSATKKEDSMKEDSKKESKAEAACGAGASPACP